MNKRTKALFFSLLLTFFSSSRSELADFNDNRIVFTQGNNLLSFFGITTRIGDQLITMGDQLFFNSNPFVVKALGSNFFGLKKPPLNVKATSFNKNTSGTFNFSEGLDFVSRSASQNLGSKGQIGLLGLSAPLKEVKVAMENRFLNQQTSFFRTNDRQTTVNTNADLWKSGIPDIKVSVENLEFEMGNMSNSSDFSITSAIPLSTATWIFGAILLALLRYSKRINYI